MGPATIVRQRGWSPEVTAEKQKNWKQKQKEVGMWHKALIQHLLGGMCFQEYYLIILFIPILVRYILSTTFCKGMNKIKEF